ncbi:general secretion pathway protein GspD [Aureisphaera galaxeae]|uniref:type II secretion system protein GspD n=1 Tax=Aureisphaera galaxeae TaxID=1538023 RepID=UPI002350C77D|nr:general secretion pathway protein GspD [Aureisphaera galaxeae]MDC8005227.1 general secretion pathway protein GspD [Aureisphaera galaxeae]
MKKILIIILFFVAFTGFAQDPSSSARINSIQNQLELLKVEVPGLEESININITQTTLSNFLLAVSKIHSININVAPDLNSITLVNNFSDVPVADILLFLVKTYDLDIDFTGNILSIKKYVAPIETPQEKQIKAIYTVSNGNLTLDLKNDPLDKVFRKIMDETGKNLLFTPEIETNPLSIYIKNVPLDVALQKMAESNNLILEKNEDGFYTFDSAFEPTQTTGANGATATRPPRRRTKSNFYYKVLDTINKRVEVNLQNTNIADVIYTLGQDLKIDIFTATSLDNAGTATVEAKDIDFDLLLDKIFQSNGSAPTAGGTANATNSNAASAKFTYKKEGNVYYFGTEDQLSLKQVELVTMMHRSVQLLDDPSGGGQRRAGRNNFNTGGQNFVNATGFNNNNQNTNRFNNTNTNRNASSGDSKSIEEIIPEDIKEGLDIKIDKELNSFVISGPGAKVERFKEFISFIDKPVPVILIEVMILEVNRSSLTETGISFGIGDKPVNTSGEFFPSGNVTIGAKDVNKIIGNFDNFGSLNLGKVVPNFYLDIKAMESAGTLKVKSTPKLTTINGHKAYLSSGETTYYAVTSQSFFGSQIPQTSEIRNYVPIDAELALEILPFVSGDGQITLDIQVLQSAFNGERVAEDAPPGITSREFSSIVRMEDQDVVILGGIESIRKDDSGSGVPLLARIPVLKWFFSKRRREATKRNLNILIKPTVIE